MKRYKASGFDVWEYEEAGSTNAVAEAIPLAELKDRMAVLTWRQTQGRGQAGNHWESAPDRNIAVTLVLRPERLEAVRQFAVSMVIALGCRDFVSRYVDQVRVKWPNDIYVGDRKISGILIEHRIAGEHVQVSLCGIGLNVNQSDFLSDAPNPVSLYQLTGRELPLAEALSGLLECIGMRYGQLADYGLLEKEFRHHLYRARGVYPWEDENGAFRASVTGVDEYGQLILRDTEGKERIYAFKEVKYL